MTKLNSRKPRNSPPESAAGIALEEDSEVATQRPQWLKPIPPERPYHA